MASIGEIVSTYLTQNQTNSMSSISLISKQLVARINQESKQTAVDLTRTDYVRADNSRAKLLAYKGKVADELSAMTKAKGTIEWASSKLNTMLAKAQATLGSTDPDERAALAQEVHDALGFINNKVKDAGQKIGNQTVNLVGDTRGPDYKTDNLYIHTGTKGGRDMVNGAFMGSAFHIEDTNGYMWTYNETTQTYTQRDANNDSTGTTLTVSGMGIDSVDHDTGAISIGGGQLTGTLVKAGIGVMDSAFYNDFATDADIQNAIDDMLAGVNYVMQKGAHIKADATIMRNVDRGISEQLSNLNKDIDRITREELDEASAKKRAASLKASLAVNNINLVAQHNTSIVQNLLDSTQGLAAAPGVFGQLGY